MESILISKLKVHIIATIKEVIQRKEFIVFDRNNAVASLQPIQEESGQHSSIFSIVATKA